MSIRQSYGYTEQLQAHANAHRGTGLKADILTGASVVTVAHWLGNRRRKKVGLPQEPMSNVVGVPIAAGLGYVFWWLPFAIYMILDVAVFHLHWISFFLTVGLFVGGFMLWKKHRAKKYEAYNAAQDAKAWETAARKSETANDHAPGSSEWLAEAGQRMRRNLNL